MHIAKFEKNQMQVLLPNGKDFGNHCKGCERAVWRSSGKATHLPCFQDVGHCNYPEVTCQEPHMLWVLKAVHCVCACMHVSEVGEGVTWPETF